MQYGLICRTDDDEALRVQRTCQSLATLPGTGRHRSIGIVSLKTMTACIFTPSSSLKMRKITPVTHCGIYHPWWSPVSSRERELPLLFVCIMRARSQSMVDGNAYELLLIRSEPKIEQLAKMKLKISIWPEQLSRVIAEGHQGDEHDELSTLAELEDIEGKFACVRWIPSALNFPGKARLLVGNWSRCGNPRDIESLLPHNESLFQKVNFLMQAARVASSTSTEPHHQNLLGIQYSCRRRLRCFQLWHELWVYARIEVELATPRRAIIHDPRARTVSVL